MSVYVSQTYGLVCGLNCFFYHSLVLVWILMMRALRLEALLADLLVEPHPPQLCLNCWKDFVNAELAVMQEMKLAVLSLWRFIKQPAHRLSDGEPRPSLSVQKMSRSPDLVPASWNHPPHSCHVLPKLSLQLEAKSLALTHVILSHRFPHCRTSPHLLLIIMLLPSPSQRKRSRCTLSQLPSSAPLWQHGSAWWGASFQRM